MLKAHAKPAIVACVALALLVPAATAAPERAAAQKLALQRAVDKLGAAGVPGVIALARDGDRTIRVAGGYADRKAKTRIRTSDRFRVGSVTKTFVGTVVLQLVGERKLSLDDTVERRLPGLVPKGEGITIRQLLNMTSGLFDYLDDRDTTIADRVPGGDIAHRWSPRELVAIATAHQPDFPPGARWTYCNTCYILLGLIVEKATGNSIGAELRKRIFEPLRLRETTFDTEPGIAGRHSHGYFRNGKQLLDMTGLSPSLAWAAGAIASTADDIATFYRALLGGRLLRPQLLREMRTGVVTFSPKHLYGLGLAQWPLACGPSWGNQGDIPGFQTWAYASRDGRRQFVVFLNLDETSMSKRAARALDGVLNTAYCGAKGER